MINEVMSFASNKMKLGRNLTANEIKIMERWIYDYKYDVRTIKYFLTEFNKGSLTTIDELDKIMLKKMNY